MASIIHPYFMAQAKHSDSLLDLSGVQDALRPAPRLAVVQTEWNSEIVQALREGAMEVWAPFLDYDPKIYTVPGAFELPFACRRVWENSLEAKEPLEAILALGAVIRGGTPHFDYVCQAVTQGVLSLNMQAPIPVLFGVLTLDSDLQAWDRLGGRQGHKGKESGVATLKMVAWNRSLARP